MGRLKLIMPNRNIVNFYLKLHIRFLKINKLYQPIKHIYLSNERNSNKTFINKLNEMIPNEYFASFDKGWSWNDLIIKLNHSIDRDTLADLNRKLLKMLSNKGYDKYDWDRYMGVYDLPL